MSNLQDIITTLPTLNAEELETIQSRLLALRNLSSPTPATDDESWVLQCICDQLASMGVEFPLVPMLHRVSDSTFKSKVKSVITYLGKSRLNRIEKRAVIMIGVGLLYDNLIGMGMTTSSRTIMRHFHRLPAVLNAAFPGYAGAGMLRMLFHRGFSS